MTTEKHPSELVDKAIKKRFQKLCTDKEFREKFWWWSFKIIGNAPYIENPLPKFTGDKDAVSAYRAHTNQLIKIYMPGKKQSCGHVGRRSHHCAECVRLVEQDFEAMKQKIKLKKELGY